MKKTSAMIAILLTIGVFPRATHAQSLADFYPLRVGDRWSYRVMDPRTPPQKGEPKKTVMIEVEGTESYKHHTGRFDEKTGMEIIENRTGYVLKTSSGNKTTRDLIVGLDSGFFRARVADIVLTPPLPFLKNSERWECDTSNGATSIKGTYAAKVNVNVTVPSGAYKTIQVSFTNNKLGKDLIENEAWYAKDVGMVRQRVKAKEHEIVLELEKHTPAKK